MKELTVLLRESDSGVLVTRSMALQEALHRSNFTFKINFQSGQFAQFFVETNCCAEHFEKALSKLGFNVDVSEPEPLTEKETCHDCQMAS